MGNLLTSALLCDWGALYGPVPQSRRMQAKQLRTATLVVCRECFPPNGGSLPHVTQLIDEFLSRFVSQSAFSAACGHNTPIETLEFLLPRTAPDWREAVHSAAKGGQLQVLRWISELQDGRGAWRRDYEGALKHAAANGHLEVLEWLKERWDIKEKRFSFKDKKIKDKFTSGRQGMGDAARNGHLAVVQWLHSICPEECCHLPYMTIGKGHLAMIQWFCEVSSVDLDQTSMYEMDETAGHGRLDVLQWLHDKQKLKCTPNAVISAAENGHLDVVKWLDENGFQGCRMINLEGVAESGHLEVLQWLFEKGYANVNEMAKCSTVAAGKGHFEMVKWLHKHVTKGFNNATMEAAAGSGYLDIVMWLHERDIGRCTRWAIRDAARNGHLEVVQWFHANHYESFTVDVMNGAAERGHVKIVRWLNENRSEGCTADAMDLAAWHGHLDAVVYLFEHSIGSFTSFPRVPSCDVKVHCSLDGGSYTGFNGDYDRYQKVVRSLPKRTLEFFEKCMGCLAQKAVITGDVKTLDWLSQFKLKLNTTRPIQDAVERGDWKLVQWFHRHDFGVCNPSMIALAIRKGRIRLVMWYHEQGLALDGPTCIAGAAMSWKISLMRWMIENGFKLDSDTAFMIAEHYGCEEVTSWLSERDRLVIVLKAVRSVRSDDINLRRLLWWTLAKTHFEEDKNRLAIRDAINRVPKIYKWLERSLNGEEVSHWLFSRKADGGLLS